MVPDEHIGQWSNDRNCSRLRGRERLAKQIPCFTASLQEAEWPADPHKSEQLPIDGTLPDQLVAALWHAYLSAAFRSAALSAGA